MIARIWRGRVAEAKSAAYFDYLKKTGLTEYAATKGNRGITVLRRIQNGEAEFLLITFWESYDAIRRFAGPEFQKAVYYPEDKNFLLEMEPRVAHYEILMSPVARQAEF